MSFVYKDMAFCHAYNAGLCVNHGCHRALTEDKQSKANHWWHKYDAHSEAPIMFTDFSHTCGELIAPEDGEQ